jgi:nucleotide-binding universal stress UspA family protein
MNMVKEILVPIDFSGNTDKVVESAIKMAEKFKAEIHLFYVSESLAEYSGFVIPHISTDVLAEEMLDQAKKKMNHFLDLHRDQGCKCDGEVVQGDDVAEEIINYAADKKFDMIVMGTHGYKGIEKTLMGSVAEKVLRNAHCPVTVVRPK